MKYFGLLFGFIFLFYFPTSAQQKSNAFSQYIASLYAYVQEEIYPIIEQSLYDVEEAPPAEEFVVMVKKIDSQLREHSASNGLLFNDSEKAELEALRRSLMMELSEAYMERATELSSEEKTGFFLDYLKQMEIFEGNIPINDELASAVIMSLHFALDVPFGMPTKKVEDFILAQNEPIRENLRATMVINEMVELSGGYEVSERLVNQFKDEYPQSSHLPTILEDLKNLERLRTGARVADFEFKDLTGAEVRLSDYEDKIIYLDLWASWCGPCIQTFKTKTPEFERKLRGLDDIVLMYISVDEKEESWKNYLDKNPMNGVHLFAGKGFEAEIMKYFKVWGIPRYLILGKGNKIIKVNAPRPGDEAYEALIEIGEGTE